LAAPWPKYATAAAAGDALCGRSAAAAMAETGVAAAGFFDLAAAAIGGSAPIWLQVRTNMASGLVLESNCNTQTEEIG